MIWSNLSSEFCFFVPTAVHLYTIHTLIFTHMDINFFPFQHISSLLSWSTAYTCEWQENYTVGGYWIYIILEITWLYSIIMECAFLKIISTCWISAPMLNFLHPVWLLLQVSTVSTTQTEEYVFSSIMLMLIILDQLYKVISWTILSQDIKSISHCSMCLNQKSHLLVIWTVITFFKEVMFSLMSATYWGKILRFICIMKS